MPSSATAGRIHKLLRVSRKFDTLAGSEVTLTDSEVVVSGGSFQLVPQVSPPDNAVEGVIYMDTDHKLYVHNGTAFVVVGGQS